MKNEPLDLDWRTILHGVHGAPPPELEVVPSKEPAHIDGFPGIEAKILRFRGHHHGGGFIFKNLTVHGAKHHSSLRQLEVGVFGKKPSRKQKDSETRGRATQAETIASPVSISDPDCSHTSSNSNSSLVFHCPKKLEGKAYAPFDEELSFISRDKQKRSWLDGRKVNESKYTDVFSSQPANTSFREMPFRCFLGVKRDSCSNSHHTHTGSFNSSLHEKRKFASQISKRFGNQNLLKSKVNDVVILDEEAQSTQPVNENMSEHWKETKVYYPSRDDPDSVEISYSDIKCLDPESFLTSTIMNFYIQYLQRSLASFSRARDKYYIFNTYFYEKLKEAVFCEGDKGASFLKLRRWSKRVNIFQKSYIFLPIHGHLHWSLVIICIPAKEDGSGPVILHLDSLGVHTSQLIFDVVDSYLRDEWNFMNESATPLDIPFSRSIWQNLPHWIEKKKIMVPQQKNEYDCGIFVLYFMERFIREAPERIRTKDLNMFGSKWFQPEEASNLRKRIRALLLEEFESAMLDNEEESPASSGCSENCGEMDEPDVVESIILD
ncbi:hypothetical protein J5N97_019512 [Dioscorea zingiberensis]|uniref:Ubiquitin-like protease family profile domain-containing protein n=1 Tax=Dioscorea zingiberensis TaxID=325984 RepID=A0A9D5HCX9_9LILI|nr:hypothetical protein J5N97_019512 [Dioscorea zingiberensis]